MPLPAIIIAAAAAVAPQPAIAVRTLDGVAQVERAGGFILLQGTVGGRPATIMLDNGAERTLVDRAFAERSGLPFAGAAGVARTVNGQVGFRLTRPAALTVDGVLEARLPLAAIDLAAIGRVAGRRIDAILGADLLGRVRLALDARTLAVAPAATPPGAAPFRVGSPPRLQVTAGEASLLLMLDLGYHGSLSVTPAAWERIGAADAQVYAAHTAGVDGVAAAIRVARLPAFAIGALAGGAVEVEIGRQPARAGDGLIGAALLDRFAMILDLGQGRIWLSPAPPPPA